MSDCISREDVLNAINDIGSGAFASYSYYSNLFDFVCELPSVEPERKKGKWVEHDTGHSIYYDCSLCGCLAPCTQTADKIIWKMANYCPDCGRLMR